MTTLVDCPQGDRAHWSFRLAGTPVRVEIWFWIAMLIAASQRSLVGALIWVAVGFVSILLHEMGHVLAFRFFRCNAEVVLYGFGGLAIPDREVIGTWPRVLVALAGPVAGFCLAGLALLATVLSGGHIWFSWYMYLPHVTAAPNFQLLVTSRNISLYSYGTMFLNDLLFINFYWGLVNLLPVWPLDGGHVSRAVFEQRDHFDGRRKSLIVSAAISAAVALAAVSDRNLWVAAMFGIFAVSSVQAMGGEQRRAIPTDRRWRDSR